ncbi:MAG: polyprenyl synthetase family protein [Proteobacteria bacterium]|nr:polyprenyl synthetase family protein [Pseudomonadota bacterium]MBI3497249.1 polyprenyl synthetase family protein [Pseudomonadota bacterium]
MASLQTAMAEAKEAVEAAMDRLLPPVIGPEAILHEATRYATLGGGKRLRPLLVMHSAGLFGVAESCKHRTAAAVEFLHCYSLIHDDLPAMDNSDLRHGRATVHKKFDEATAILAGDGLLTMAFEVLSHPDTHSDPLVRSELVRELAEAAGPRGMVGGQMLDLLAEHQTFDIPAITRLQRMKTGAIFQFACIAGAILGKAAGPLRQALAAYAQSLGLAFQIADDLLDAEGSAAELGKPTGQDATAGKATFVSILGVERARAQARLLADQAIEHLQPFAEKADTLRAVARFVVERRA